MFKRVCETFSCDFEQISYQCGGMEGNEEKNKFYCDDKGFIDFYVLQVKSHLFRAVIRLKRKKQRREADEKVYRRS